MRPTLLIVIASTRPGRVGLPIAEWLEARADAHGMTAPLKYALDYLSQEWAYKPLGLVSYGSVSAGTRAAQMIKQVATTLGMFPVFDAVSIPFVAQFVGEGGEIVPNEVMTKAATGMLDELLRVSAAFTQLRAG